MVQTGRRTNSSPDPLLMFESKCTSAFLFGLCWDTAALLSPLPFRAITITKHALHGAHACTACDGLAPASGSRRGSPDGPGGHQLVVLSLCVFGHEGVGADALVVAQVQQRQHHPLVLLGRVGEHKGVGGSLQEQPGSMWAATCTNATLQCSFVRGMQRSVWQSASTARHMISLPLGSEPPVSEHDAQHPAAKMQPVYAFFPSQRRFSPP